MPQNNLKHTDETSMLLTFTPPNRLPTCVSFSASPQHHQDDTRAPGSPARHVFDLRADHLLAEGTGDNAREFSEIRR